MEKEKFQAYIQISFPSLPNKFEEYWLTIQDFWFSLSKKYEKSPSYLFPLQIQSLSSAEKETQKLNSLKLETSKISGGHQIFIVSTNRIEIIQIYLALQNAHNIFHNKLSEYIENPQQMIDISGEISTGFMNKTIQKLTIKVTSQEISIETQENETSQQISLFKIQDINSITPKQNDLNCSHRVLIYFQNGGLNDSSHKPGQDSNSLLVKEFTIPDLDQLEQLISSVLFFRSTCQ